jgi:hypothetical protein
MTPGTGASAPRRRALAEQMTDPVSRTMMLGVATDYERLAARAEERLAKPRE